MCSSGWASFLFSGAFRPDAPMILGHDRDEIPPPPGKARKNAGTEAARRRGHPHAARRGAGSRHRARGASRVRSSSNRSGHRGSHQPGLRKRHAAAGSGGSAIALPGKDRGASSVCFGPGPSRGRGSGRPLAGVLPKDATRRRLDGGARETPLGRAAVPDYTSAGTRPRRHRRPGESHRSSESGSTRRTRPRGPRARR